ncbi:MAG: hypothetical protein LBD30_08950 [Verrucomicrobiales bacterium]|jgi:hypothetical protein|nr:hypothetical protein [Verrucomicrobiales bacterium]
MTTAERVAVIASAFNGRADLGFNSEADLRGLIIGELGDVEIFERPVLRGGVPLMARPPETIYHLCAANLGVSAETSLVLGLLLGSRLYFKLPGGGLPAFVNTVSQLPPTLREKVILLARHDPALMLTADAVIVYGNDATIDAIHRQVSWRQRFLAYGHKISLGLIDADDETPAIASAAAREILAHEQLGCLSPQAYLCRDAARAEKFSALLADALAAARRRQPLPALTFDETALRQHFRQTAAANGEKILTGADHEYIIISGAKKLVLTPARATVSVLDTWEIADCDKWRGKLSAVSHTRPLPLSVTDYFTKLGVSRFCPTGGLQAPPLAWRHDSRPRLADLLKWITFA